MKTEKPLYKVWDIKNETYVSGTAGKTTWATLNGAIDKVRNLCLPEGRFYDQPSRVKPERFEIRLFGLYPMGTIAGRDAFDSKQKKVEADKARKLAKTLIRNEIYNLIPVEMSVVRTMLKNDKFSEAMTERLEKLFADLARLEHEK